MTEGENELQQRAKTPTRARPVERVLAAQDSESLAERNGVRLVGGLDLRNVSELLGN